MRNGAGAAAAGGRHGNRVAPGGRARVGGNTRAAASPTGDQGCGQQSKYDQAEGQLRAAFPSRDKQQKEAGK